MDNQLRKKRQRRGRAKIHGSKTRPRASIYRSLQRIYLQLIDDEKGETLLAVRSEQLKKKPVTKTEQAFEAGKKAAELAKVKKIESVVFDRGGYKYHGRVKAVAEGLRAGGLKF